MLERGLCRWIVQIRWFIQVSSDIRGQGLVLNRKESPLFAVARISSQATALQNTGDLDFSGREEEGKRTCFVLFSVLASVHIKRDKGGPFFSLFLIFSKKELKGERVFPLGSCAWNRRTLYCACIEHMFPLV